MHYTYITLTMTLDQFNTLSTQEQYNALERCCGAEHWVKQMVAKAPFESKEQLLYFADYLWENAHEESWLEAFTPHPKIGDVNSLAEKYNNTKEWAEGEQKGVTRASTETLEALAKGNEEYEQKFGYIFIVCATGKSAKEMNDLLQTRLPNKKEDELLIAMKEQQKITKIRLEKLIDVNHNHMSQLTTHVLDTSIGKPGEGINIQLQENKNSRWHTIAEGTTDADGRISDLLDETITLTPATYKMVFDTGKYFTDQKKQAFYPTVVIYFEITDDSHYHVPLLLNPFGYSTYRGS